LVRLGDREDDYDLPSLGSARERRWPDFVGHDVASFGRAAGEVDWLRTSVLAAGMVLGSAAFDKSADRLAEKHNQKRWARKAIDVGEALPIAALGLSGVFALDDSRPALSDAGVAALEAGALAFVAAEGFKYALGRARPDAGLGRSEFDPGSSQNRFKSFPSRHATLMWAALTPYAKEYSANWLYGVAAITNAARVGSREHWLSDTVGGAALGYVIGSLTWEARREARRAKDGPTVAVAPGEVQLKWDID
jgi:membrane-associated phospholipid phosphatase